MILVVSATNRPDSYTRKVSTLYHKLLLKESDKASLIFLEDLPKAFFSTDVYDHKTQDVRNIIDTLFVPAEKFVFIVPEYNGSYPGILKLLIDTLEIKRCFDGKKAGIIGISSGRSGNLRGIDHLMSVLNHIKIQIMPDQPKLSLINKAFNENDDLNDQYMQRVTLHAQNMLRF